MTDDIQWKTLLQSPACGYLAVPFCRLAIHLSDGASIGSKQLNERSLRPSHMLMSKHTVLYVSCVVSLGGGQETSHTMLAL